MLLHVVIPLHSNSTFFVFHIHEDRSLIDLLVTLGSSATVIGEYNLHMDLDVVIPMHFNSTFLYFTFIKIDH